MPILRRIVSAFRRLFAKTQVERDMDEELRAYLETAVEHNMSAGMSRDEAVRAARVEIGSLDAIKEGARDVGWESTMETFWQDLRFALRTMAVKPAFSSIAVLSLALGIGANTAIFSVWHGVLRAPLPGVDGPEGLVLLTDPGASGMVRGRLSGARRWLSYAEFEQLRVVAMLLSALGVYGLVSFAVVQRTREMGIRRALGARTPDIVRLIVGGCVGFTALGLAIGLGAGALGATVLRGFLTGVSPLDPWTMAAVACLVMCVALIASALPAVRATQGDPAVTLRDV